MVWATVDGKIMENRRRIVMKKLKALRKIVSFILCLAMAVSAFSVLAFAEEADAEEAKEEIVDEYACPHCGGTPYWYEPGSEPKVTTHFYDTYDSYGNKIQDICTVTTIIYYQDYICSNCGTVLAENTYTGNVTHSKCGGY